MRQVKISVENLGVCFELVHDRSFSLKETLIKKIKNLFKPQRSKELFWALRGVSFKVYEGETFGIIGENGAGKSVLLQTLAGIIKPTEGNIKTSGKIATLIELGAGFQPELTGAENLFLNAAILGLSREETKKKFRKIVEFAELENFIDIPIKNYSAGMYLRLGFSIAVEVDPEILLIDEILAVGDEHFQKKCLDKIRKFKESGATIVIVSHSMELIEEFCERAICIHHGKILAEGNPSEVITAYKNRYGKIKYTHDQKDEIIYPIHHLNCALEANKPILPLGELINKIVSQTFTIEHNNLCEIGVIFGTYQRENTCNVLFKLEEIEPQRRIIYKTSVNAKKIRDNEWYYFSFPYIKESAHRKYKFTIWTDSTNVQNTITLWYNDKENFKEEKFYINEVEHKGFICFRVNYLKNIYL